jgi:predicted esterase
MSITKLKPITLTKNHLQVQGFHLEPPPEKRKADWSAIMTHGYTSHKGSIINWAFRLIDMGIPVIIFDLPGHYLGSFLPAYSFDEFTQFTPSLFQKAHEILLTPNVFFLGHSLGALMSLKALQEEENYFNNINVHVIGVGFGFGGTKEGKDHVFESDFYQKTLQLRGLLVDPVIPPSLIFPWIRSQKENLTVSHRKITMITGEDDVVATVEKVTALSDHLIRHGNECETIIVRKLSHHMPELATPTIATIIKQVMV